MPMQFDEFCEFIKKNIGDYLPECHNLVVEIRDTKKNNGVILRSLCMRDDLDNNCASNIYLEAYYKQYMDKLAIERVMQEIAEEYRNSRETIKTKGISADFFSNLDPDNIIIKLVNYEKNKEQLDECPHVRFQDLAVTFRAVCFSSDSDLMSALVDDRALAGMNMTVDELYSKAKENYSSKFPTTIRSLGSVLAGLMGDFPMPPLDTQPDMDIYVLTNKQCINGATNILLDDAIAEAEEKIGGNFYIIPSSVHETLLVPENSAIDPNDIAGMVYDINRSVVREDEVLSDTVYFYDAATKQISMVNPPKSKEEEKQEEPVRDNELDDMDFPTERGGR